MKYRIQFLLLFVTVVAAAQTVELSNGYKMPPKTNKFRIAGQNNDGIVMRLYGQDDVIEVFDDKLKLITSRTIDFKNQSGPMQYIMLNKNGAVIFYLMQDKKFSVLLAQPVNSKFIEIGKPLVVDTIYDRRDLVANNLRFKPSVDQNYLTVYYPYFSSGNIQSIKFICMDQSVRTLYNKTVPVNRSERDLEESRMLIDNNGNTFLILRNMARMDMPEYVVLKMSSTGDFTTFNVNLEKALFGEANFDFDNKNGNLILTAFYNDDRNAEDVANGFIYSSYDAANGTNLKINYIPFTKDFIAELTGRPALEKGKLYTFSIRKMLLRNDGGALIVAESFIKDTREVPVAIGFQPGFNNYHTSQVYQFNDIIAFSISPNAEVEWHSVMRKKQASEDDNGIYSSFLTMNEKDKLHFIYLDDVNINGVLNQYVLSSDGKVERAALLNQEDKDVMMLPKLGRQITPNQVIVPSYLNGILRLVKITF